MRLVHLRTLFLLLVVRLWLPRGGLAQPTTNAVSVLNAPNQICPLPIGGAVP